MRALTLTQPWAGLVASGIKLVENRPRSMIKREDFGKPFAIHASREIEHSVFERIEEIAPELDWCRPRYGSCDLVDGHGGSHWTVGCHGGALKAHDRLSWSALSRITSAVIAVATIDHMIETVGGLRSTRDIMDLGEAQERWFFGPIGYVLRDVIALPTPVPCKGKLGFWTLPADIDTKVRAQLEVRS